MKDGQPFRAIHSGLLQVSRRFLLLICLCAGAYFLLNGKSVGFSILLLLTGLWLILDNPLESFEILEGPCPSCGHRVKVRRRSKFHCSACRRTIIVEAGLFCDEPETSVPFPDTRVLQETAAEDSPFEHVVIRPHDTIDLHTFSPKEVVSLLNEFIDLSCNADIRLVKIIHGKGTGVLRRRVHRLLARDPRVVAFHDAPPRSGGWGATIVELNPGGQRSDHSVNT